MANNFKLSAPWASYYRKVQALFGDDPEIKIVFDEDALTLHLLVDNPDKAEALTQLLPTEKTFGAVTLKIAVIPANVAAVPSKVSLLKTAFMGNPALSFIASASDIFTNPIHYVVFANKVVQYFNDDLGDVNGNCSTLYQEIAKDILGDGDGIHYCTDTPGADGKSLGAPLGEWP